jgi:putative transposase
MKRKRYTEEQIVQILKEASSGIPAAELCRKYGMSEPSFYKWRSKYAGMEISDLRKMKSLEEENRRLKHIVADLTLDVRALKAINEKNW